MSRSGSRSSRIRNRSSSSGGVAVALVAVAIVVVIVVAVAAKHALPESLLSRQSSYMKKCNVESRVARNNFPCGHHKLTPSVCLEAYFHHQGPILNLKHVPSPPVTLTNPAPTITIGA